MIEIKVTRQHPSGYGKTPPEIYLREIRNYVDIFKGDIPAAQKADAGHVKSGGTVTKFSPARV